MTDRKSIVISAYVLFFVVAMLVKPVSAFNIWDMFYGHRPTGLFSVPLGDILNMATYSSCISEGGNCVWSASECSATCEGSYYSCKSSTDCDTCCCVCGSVLETTTTSSTVPITTTTTSTVPGTCSCSGWYPGRCGESGCDSDERYYWRMCTPDGCLPDEKCSSDAGCAQADTPSTTSTSIPTEGESCPGECASPTECSVAGYECDYSYDDCDMCCCVEKTAAVGCTDTDLGVNVYVKGSCTDGDGTHTDSCMGTSVREYSCGGGDCNYEDVVCTGGMACDGGICKASAMCEDYTSQECKESCGKDDTTGYGSCPSGETCCLSPPPKPGNA